MKAKIKDKKEIANGTLQVIYELLGEKPEFKAGQYFFVTLPQLHYPDNKGNRRHFSIVNSPSEKGILTNATRVRDSGFKKTLKEIEVGSYVEVGPIAGSFVLPIDTKNSLVFIAGGIGITPFISMLRFATEEKLPFNITILYSNKDRNSTAFLEELENLSNNNSNIKLVLTMTKDDMWKGEKRRINSQFIKDYISDFDNVLYYVAGPPLMIETIIESARSRIWNILREIPFEVADNLTNWGSHVGKSIIDDRLHLDTIDFISKYVKRQQDVEELRNFIPNGPTDRKVNGAAWAIEQQFNRIVGIKTNSPNDGIWAKWVKYGPWSSMMDVVLAYNGHFSIARSPISANNVQESDMFINAIYHHRGSGANCIAYVSPRDVGVVFGPTQNDNGQWDPIFVSTNRVVSKTAKTETEKLDWVIFCDSLRQQVAMREGVVCPIGGGAQGCCGRNRMLWNIFRAGETLPRIGRQWGFDWEWKDWRAPGCPDPDRPLRRFSDPSPLPQAPQERTPFEETVEQMFQQILSTKNKSNL